MILSLYSPLHILDGRRRRRWCCVSSWAGRRDRPPSPSPPPSLPPTFYEKAPGKSISHSSRSSSSRLRVEPSFSLCLSLSPSSREKPTSPAGPLVDTEPPGQVLERAEKKEGEAFSGNPSTWIRQEDATLFILKLPPRLPNSFSRQQRLQL